MAEHHIDLTESIRRLNESLAWLVIKLESVAMIARELKESGADHLNNEQAERLQRLADLRRERQPQQSGTVIHCYRARPDQPFSLEEWRRIFEHTEAWYSLWQDPDPDAFDAAFLRDLKIKP